VSSAPPDGATPTLSPSELTALISALQVELVSLKSRVTERDAQNDSLRETILNLTHENDLLHWRLYGNKTEHSQTSELQLTLGDLLDAEKRLQKKLDEAVAKAKNGAGVTTRLRPTSNPNPSRRAAGIWRSASCHGSRSRSSTRSSRKPPSGSASRTAFS
jgi:hypothetical protein